ncbi:MAG: 16S rRNA (cytosine(1402)-N(4))-methyltransferase RsmH [Chlamydiia bacterium]|nr:16S rRNA (cytosine(1402)-N(4))-methyltransferase RsmH [Chlamydiia bacterium]
MHKPVLLREVLQIFQGLKIELFFEGTVGAGGHAEAILTEHPEIGRYFACDRDPVALQLAKERLKRWEKKVEWIHGDYADLPRYLDERGVHWIDGYLIDIGVSSMQIDSKERGFSFQGDAPLDMRMNPIGETTAEMLLNRLSEKELARIFFEYGEERRSRQAAKAIVEARKKKKIRTTAELVRILQPVIRSGGKIHPATRIFQALRIAVNDELGQLQLGVEGAIQRLQMGGRMAVISFHSLEDRIVKHAFRGEKQLKILTKKPVGPTAEECKANPRSRSAKLRAAEKFEE